MGSSDGSSVGAELSSADGAGVTSGLPWATDGSGEPETAGTEPSGPLAPAQATASEAIVRTTSEERVRAASAVTGLALIWRFIGPQRRPPGVAGGIAVG